MLRILEPLLAFCLSYRRALSALLWASLLATTAAGLWRFYKGRYWQQSQQLEMAIYLLPMYLLVIWWGIVMLRRPGVLTVRAVCVDGLVVALSALRCVTNIIPASGHVLFLLYAMLVTPSNLYVLLAGTFLSLTVCMKLAWLDVVTPSFAAVLAVAFWRLRLWARRRDLLPAQV